MLYKNITALKLNSNLFPELIKDGFTVAVNVKAVDYINNQYFKSMMNVTFQTGVKLDRLILI